MLGSILHRVTGVGNYLGAVALVAWLAVAASSRDIYDAVSAVAGSLFGMVVVFGFTLSFCYHLLNGVRHLFLDAGVGFEPKAASFSSMLTLVGAVVLAAAAFVLAGLTPLYQGVWA